MLTHVLPKGPFNRLASHVCLVITALLGLGIVGCESDPQDQSIAEQIVGEWTLVRLTGGVAGLDLTYSAADSPETITFDDEGEYTFIRRGASTGADTLTGQWFMTEVARTNDTLSFRFTDQLPRDLASRRMYLIGQTRLQTQIDCCDQFDYTYEKRD